MKVTVITVGCRLNQSESDALRARLSEQGVSLVSDVAGAAVCFVNTCAVTAAAERSSVQKIRKACRLGCRVVVLGCLADRAPLRMATIDGVDEVWDNRRKQSEIAGGLPATIRSRPALKVQDGCDEGCSYCVSALVRGRPWSVPVDTARRWFERLSDAGQQEIVLTGLNLARYEGGIARLLRAIFDAAGRSRLRLASLLPSAFSDEFLELLSHWRVCPHFHIPVQSGDDRVLIGMGRRYSSADAAEVLRRLRDCRPDACIGADVMVGFPNEDEKAFARTLDHLAASPVDYLHVFKYSPRPGTSAYRLGDPVPARVKRERVRVLREFSRQRRAAFELRWLGTTRQALLETDGWALTDNYIRVRVPDAAGAQPGALIDVVLGQQGMPLIGNQVASDSLLKEV